MLSILGRPRTVWDGWTRREVLQAAGAGLMGLSVPRLLQAEASPGARNERGGRAKSVIFMFLFGGPSQLETFDMKPDAIAEIRGPVQPTPCRTPGYQMSEHLPHLARTPDEFSRV